jgi:hypothetical protein
LTTVAYELGDCLLWAFLKKMQKLPIFELFTLQKLIINFDTKWVGVHWGDFLTNSYGHPV